MARTTGWSARPVRRMSPLLGAVLLVALGATGCGGDDWPIQGDGAPGIDDVSINQQVLGFLGDNDLPGATLAVTRNGRLVWSKAYGWADETKQIRMKPWHRSRIGSVSKVITTIGLLQLLQTNDATLGSLAVSASSLEAKLAQKVYGHTGADFTDPSWPDVAEPTVLAEPEQYWEAIRDGALDLYGPQYETEMARTMEWVSQVELGHLLSHTSGLVRSGSTTGAADYYGVDSSELTYPDIHKWVLKVPVESKENSNNVKCYQGGALYVDEDDPAYTGKVYQLPPFLFEPGTDECYSNHGFGLLGHVIDELSGPGADNTYHRVIERNVLEPLGLFDVVANNTDISELDAWPHGSSLDPSEPSVFGTATGGWSASAQDLARVMCGLDRVSDNLRLLEPQTVTTMETIAYPDASSTQPLGWDSRGDYRLYKNGAISGGDSVIIKYLPGEFDSAPDDEINIAININASADSHPSSAMLRDIAEKVAAADIPDDYDLFEPEYACVVDKPLTLVHPTPTPPVTPRPSPTPEVPDLVVPTTPTTTTTIATSRPTSPAPPTPPTVFIRKPAAGQYPAPYGKTSIDFYGAAIDATGKAIAGTNYRWTAIQGANETLLCAGSGIGPAATPTGGAGGLVALTDCTSFTRTLTNAAIGAGPPITVRLEARDAKGTVGVATTTIYLFTPPTG